MDLDLDKIISATDELALCDFLYDPRSHSMVMVPFPDDAPCSPQVRQKRLEFWAEIAKGQARKKAAEIAALSRDS